MSFSNACAVGYFFIVIASSSLSGPVALPNSYQRSLGSSARPSFAFISAAAAAASGESRISTSSARTRASGISAAANAPWITVGAIIA